jgi:nitroimidazol reductase NimA-like FMN-containing flavoprotein (pyridoxamine 5'-phosphate oxidase superfamily)
MPEARELSYAESRGLLARQQFGHVAVSTPDGAHIIPVNYAVVDEAVVFGTSPFSVLATYGRSGKIAFEVDQVRDDEGLGWSVVVRGRAELVTDPRALARIRQLSRPHPFAGGPRHVYLRLAWQDLSGRTFNLIPARHA